MASTYSTLKIELIGTGEQAGLWGTTTNTNLGTAIEEAIVGSADVSFSSADVTVTLTDTNAAQTARNLRLNLTGTSGGARNLILGSGCQIEKPYLINNGLADTVTVKNTTGTGIAVPAGKTMWVYNNGTDVVDAVTHLSSLTLGTALPIASGGTGTTSTTFVNLATNVTGDLPFANLTQIAGLSVLGVTGNSTADVAGITAGTDNQVLRRSGTAVGFGAINLASTDAVTGDLPFSNLAQGSALSVLGVTGNATADNASIAAGTDHQVLRRSGTSVAFGAVNLAQSAAITGTLPVGNGGTGITSFGTGVATWLGTPSSANLAAAVTDETGSGSLVFATSPTLVTPILGTPQSATLTNATGLPLSTGVTGQLPLANGGTGANLVDPNADRILFWDDSAGAMTFLTVSTGLSITGTTLTATGSGGTVTSVSGTGTVNGITLTGTVTSSGSLTLGGTLSGVSLTTQVTGILPVANGGTNNAFFTVSGPATSAKTYTFANEAMTIVGESQTQTLTNKRVTPRIGTIADAATITPTGDTADQYNVTALAQPATIAAPSGTPTNGQKLVIRIKDNGTARALTWTTSSGAYRAIGVTLPITTVINKTVYVGCIYNLADTFWDVVAVAQEA